MCRTCKRCVLWWFGRQRCYCCKANELRRYSYQGTSYLLFSIVDTVIAEGAFGIIPILYNPCYIGRITYCWGRYLCSKCSIISRYLPWIMHHTQVILASSCSIQTITDTSSNTTIDNTNSNNSLVQLSSPILSTNPLPIGEDQLELQHSVSGMFRPLFVSL